MAESHIQVGKYTLESLTTGMYSDPKIIYREYIQNSVDSLENALEQHLIEPQSMRIDIIVDEENSYISIRDNGTGIPYNKAVNTLMNIGSSAKRHTNNRGFRGIGRLGGMSYCDNLIFSTSAEGENKKTIIEFDCKKLRQILVPGAYEEMDLAAVMAAVTNTFVELEKEEKHYFLVELKGVSGFSDLLNINTVKSYIAQVAPLPYQTRKFLFSYQLHKFLEEDGYSVEEFPIFIGEDSSDFEPLYKPNRHKFHADRSKKKNDELSSLKFFKVVVNEEIYALGWYGLCDWLGSISEHEISGLRVRKGNILIGDNKTLNSVFKEARFNGWTQGEVFIVTDKLIPNARRDDFEQNEAYYEFIDKLRESVGVEISKTIREASGKRNDNSAKMIREVEKIVSRAQNELEEGFNSAVDKEKIKNDLTDGLKKLSETKVRDDLSDRKTQLEKLAEITIEEVTSSSNYKINKINSGVDRKSKKMLAVISDILSKKLSKFLVDEIIEEIVQAINKE
ncbi:ATP-binding protein [[Ruminococcus] torques]|uniref:ATP-binding protein n=1 Tax=[Ruminococcus] torques TaxID=33039 RepID=UPI0025A3B7F3|nr:ATP-binding protein [[Ruminococcus] torques]MDM8237352.1 ATP-binding protein [[Ruminococcus] torques]